MIVTYTELHTAHLPVDLSMSVMHCAWNTWWHRLSCRQAWDISPPKTNSDMQITQESSAMAMISLHPATTADT